jgi:hypothetical protein
MEKHAGMEEAVARRKFLQLSGWVGMTLGALSWPSCSAGETSSMPSDGTADHAGDGWLG